MKVVAPLLAICTACSSPSGMMAPPKTGPSISQPVLATSSGGAVNAITAGPENGAIRTIVEENRDAAKVLAALRGRGLHPVARAASRAEPLAGSPGYAWQLGDDWLHLHVHPGRASAAASVSRFIKAVGAHSSIVDWVGPPHLFDCGSAVALYLGRSVEALSTLSAACGAPDWTDGPIDQAAQDSRAPEAEPATSPNPGYATQLRAPAPDYASLIAGPPVPARGELRREGRGKLPADAVAIGRAWIDRLEARRVLGGHGLAGKSADGPVIAIDTLLTAREFDAWTRTSGWSPPPHISWSFRPELVAPEVSASAAPAVRIWTASDIRTGLQHQALEGGRIVIKEGCLWLQQADRPDRIAWFNAETGIGHDAQGYLVLVNRMTGETMARLGEEMVWAGPNGLQVRERRVAEIRSACGEADLYPVGNPQSAERMLAEHPHLRRRS